MRSERSSSFCRSSFASCTSLRDVVVGGDAEVHAFRSQFVRELHFVEGTWRHCRARRTCTGSQFVRELHFVEGLRSRLTDRGRAVVAVRSRAALR